MKRAQILRKIRERYARRMPLNLSAVKREDPALVHAVYELRPYWGWKGALQEAGIDYGNIRVELRQTVECRICGKKLRMLNGHLIQTHLITPDEYRDELSHTAVSLLPHGTQLTSAGARYFGTWGAALDAARVPKRLRGRRVSYETPGDVLQAIAARLEHRFGLAPLDLYYGPRSDVPLWKKSFELFGSWCKAVAEAGGTSSQRRQAAQTPFSTKAKVIAELRRRAEAGKLLARRKMTSDDNDKHLYVMACGFFGSWQAAVRAGGFDPKAYHEWNLNPRGKHIAEKDVLAAIHGRRRQGQPLNVRGLTQGEHQDVPLLYAARKLFGGWREAIRAAGIDYEQVAKKQQDYESMKDRIYRTYSTRNEVIDEIQRRIKEQLPITYRALAHGDIDIRDNELLKAGKVLFAGDWDQALRAAGVDLKEIQPDWVRQRKKRQRQKR